MRYTGPGRSRPTPVTQPHIASPACSASEKYMTRIIVVYVGHTSVGQRVVIFRHPVEQFKICPRDATAYLPPGLWGVRKMNDPDNYCLCWPY